MANQEQISRYHLNVIPQFLRTLVVEGLWERGRGEVEGRRKTHISFTREEKRNAVSVRESIIPTVGHSHCSKRIGKLQIVREALYSLTKGISSKNT